MSKYITLKYKAVLHYLHIRLQQQNRMNHSALRTTLRTMDTRAYLGGIGALEHPQSNHAHNIEKPFILD